MIKTSKRLAFLGILGFFLAVLCTSDNYAQEPGYFSSLGRNVVRGTKNLVSFPAELVMTVKDPRYQSEPPILRTLHGLTDGTVRSFQRAFSGVWDFFVALIPSQQEGMPVKPETLF